jgi:hypothetical protein
MNPEVWGMKKGWNLMKKTKRITYSLSVAAIVLLAVFIAAPAGAGDLNRLLTGDYALNSSYVCAAAYGGFDQDLNRKPDPPGFISGTMNGSLQGVASYDGKGGFTSRVKVIAVALDPTGSPAPLKSPVAQYDMECTGTYQVNQDLSTENKYDCRLDPLAGPFSMSPYPSEFYMELKGIQAKGQLLGTMGNILTLRADTEPNVETVYFYNFYIPGPVFVPGPVKVLERICTSSGTAMKITGQSKN